MQRFQALFLLLALAACGGGGGSSTLAPPPVDAPVGLLRKVADAQELESSLKSGLVAIEQSSNSALESADLAQSAPVSSRFSGTYTQEANVDEFDSVRYDGEYLYVATNGFTYCCVAALEAAPIRDDGGNEAAVRILRTDPATQSAEEVGKISMPQGVSVQGMYTYGDYLVVLTSEFFYGGYGGPWTDLAIWAPTTSGFRIYDLTNPSEPELTYDATFDGLFVESRRIGNTMYVVSRYTPQLDGIVLPVQTSADAAANQAVLDGVTLADMLPTVTVDGATRPLVSPDACYVLSDRAAGYPVITSITAIPINNPGNYVTTCYNEEAYGVYVAETAMYLTQPNYQTATNENFTMVHKFDLARSVPDYVGSIEIPGLVWRGGQADFRMNEYNGVLRVITSEWADDRADFVDHRLFLLDESPDSPDLRIIGELPNATHPEEIGKPNESIYGVRFLAERAYVVTFLQIDPLYVIDLADPTDPRIAGELEITGFSDFLHPVSDDLLLGLGTAATGGLKLELFNVQDLEQPQSLGQVVLGGRGSYSEALSNRHAFTYLANVNGADRLAVPAQLTVDDDTWTAAESGLYLFEIRDKATPNLATLNTVGAIVKLPSEDDFYSYWVNRSRSYLHDDTIYYVRDNEVWGALWVEGTRANGPF